jgi:hypothetical protein
VGTAKDQFLTSLEMFLGAIPVARHKKEKYQKLRQSAQVIKDKTKAEAFCRYSTAFEPIFANSASSGVHSSRVVSCVRRVAGRV